MSVQEGPRYYYDSVAKLVVVYEGKRLGSRFHVRSLLDPRTNYWLLSDELTRLTAVNEMVALARVSQ
jgi:hypothetical protein